VWDERKWLECDNAGIALNFVRGRMSPRQVRLFLVAVAHRVWDKLPSDEYREAIELVDRYADGWVEEKELWALRDRYQRSPFSPYSGYQVSADARATSLVLSLAESPSRLLDHEPLGIAQRLAAPGVLDGPLRDVEAKAQVAVLRDVFGNPFDPVAPNPEWFTSTAVALARGIYEDRAFDRLPILADALQDAGCEDARVLNHCREPGEHDCGCWVLDMVLGHERPLTADEWDETTDLGWMIRTVWPRASYRKLGLVACGCVRQEGDPMRHDIWGTYSQLAERHLDGQLPANEEWPYAEGNDRGHTEDGTPLYALSYIRIDHPTNVLVHTAQVHRELLIYSPDDVWGETIANEREIAPSRLMRCVLGNPLRPPVKFPKKWKSSAVVKLAREIYDAHAFERMPELAALLEAAGCAGASVLAHCRDKGPFPNGMPEGCDLPAPPTHCRGCWVLDGLLGLK
jgi:hypothetical protein